MQDRFKSEVEKMSLDWTYQCLLPTRTHYKMIKEDSEWTLQRQIFDKSWQKFLSIENSTDDPREIKRIGMLFYKHLINGKQAQLISARAAGSPLVEFVDETYGYKEFYLGPFEDEMPHFCVIINEGKIPSHWLDPNDLNELGQPKLHQGMKQEIRRCLFEKGFTNQKNCAFFVDPDREAEDCKYVFEFDYKAIPNGIECEILK